MHVVYVHDAKIAKENGLTLQFCSNYPSKMSRNVAMYTFLTNYNTFRRFFYLKRTTKNPAKHLLLRGFVSSKLLDCWTTKIRPKSQHHI